MTYLYDCSPITPPSPQLSQDPQMGPAALPKNIKPEINVNPDSTKPLPVLSKVKPQEVTAQVVSSVAVQRMCDAPEQIQQINADEGGLQDYLQLVFVSSKLIGASTTDPEVKTAAIERAKEAERLMHQNEKNQKKFPCINKLGNREFFAHFFNAPVQDIVNVPKLPYEPSGTLTNVDFSAQIAPSYLAPSYDAEPSFGLICKLLGNKVITWMNSTVNDKPKRRILLLGGFAVMVIAKLYFDYIAPIEPNSQKN